MYSARYRAPAISYEKHDFDHRGYCRHCTGHLYRLCHTWRGWFVLPAAHGSHLLSTCYFVVPAGSITWTFSKTIHLHCKAIMASRAGDDLCRAVRGCPAWVDLKCSGFERHVRFWDVGLAGNLPDSKSKIVRRQLGTICTHLAFYRLYPK
jgi:hypothetical protein